jgi:short-subunit dehydrogenase
MSNLLIPFANFDETFYKSSMAEKKAIIIGASTGIGRALAKELAAGGYSLGLASRRLQLLQELQRELSTPTIVKELDLKNLKEAIPICEALIHELGGVDLFIINSAVGFYNPNLDWAKELETIEVNVEGFTAMTDLAMRYFDKQEKGHLVGISSVAALKGGWITPAYNASKAFLSNYLEGMRIRSLKKGQPIFVTDIRPGFVATDMTRDNRGMFWVASPEDAAKQIVQAIQKKKKIAYITKRWILIAGLSRIIPDWLYAKL